jgi:arabinogalactan endo-1,4-beta-galactosidase
LKIEKFKVLVFGAILIYFSCSEVGVNQTSDVNNESEFISAVDISLYPKIELSSPVFKDNNGITISFLEFLKSKGINTIRIRLWVNPIDEHSSFDEVKSFSETLKSMGFNIYLTLHFSDTWADPGHQIIPQDWQNIPYSDLKDKVYNYTKMVVEQINPEIIQIGNEINNGFLHPEGHRYSEPSQFLELLNEGIQAVRDHSTGETEIMLHYAGHQGSDVFFNLVKDLDYDIIGLSYYPIWHGKSFSQLEQNLTQLSVLYNKKLMIAETAYPFTLGWNDWTNNIVGLEDQLILPDFPATPQGQKDFVQQLKAMMKDVEGGIGLSYWGAELVAWNGEESTAGSPWENQAMFDFNNQALPVLGVFESP